MLKIDFTTEMVFSFEGPNLCLLGNENDFKQLGKAIINLTVYNSNNSIEITALNFVELTGDSVKVIFSSKPKANQFGILRDSEEILFELDDRYWERIFVFLAIMSWDKKTYYLNTFEDALRDLPLRQDVHLICSSEF